MPLQATPKDRFGNIVPDVGIAMAIGDTAVAIIWPGNRIVPVEAGTTAVVLSAGAITATVPVTVLAFQKVYSWPDPCGIMANGTGYCWALNSFQSDPVEQPAKPLTKISYGGSANAVLPQLKR